jgi:hypothetical protein
MDKKDNESAQPEPLINSSVIAPSDIAETMDQDPRYVTIKIDVERQWLQDNPGKNIPFSALKSEVERIFAEEYPEYAKVYVEKEKKHVYENPDDDPRVQQVQRDILNQTNLGLLGTQSPTTDTRENIWESVYSRESARLWDKFIDNFPEKARAYAEKGHLDLKDLLKKREKPTIQPESDFSPQNYREEYVDPVSQPQIITNNSYPVEQDERPDQEVNLNLRDRYQKFSRTTRENPIPNLRSTRRINIPSNTTDRLRLLSKGKRNLKNLERLRKFKRLGGNIKKARGLATLVRSGGLAAATSEVWVPILIVILIIGAAAVVFVMVILIFSGGDGGDPGDIPDLSQSPPIPNLTLEKSATTSVKNGEEVSYVISVQYGGNLDVTIHDPIPSGSEYVSSTGVSTFDKTSNSVQWKLSENNPTQSNESQSEDNFSFSLVVRPTQNDITLVNKAIATAQSNPGEGIIDVESNSLEQYFKESSEYSQVPLAMVKALSKVETGGKITNFTDDDIAELQTKNWWVGRLDNAANVNNNDPLIIKGFGYNTCQYLSCFPGADVRGVMQFEILTWNGYISRLSFSDGHEAERRYPKDIIFAAGLYLKDFGELYDKTYGGVPNATDWTKDKVERVAISYCTGELDGNPNDAACAQGGRSYSDLAWAYYQEFKAMGL